MVKTLGAVAEAQIAVLARALTAASRQGQKLVLVTGCARGEGRTTLSLTLGRALASPARRILLVDADFEHSQLADALGVLPQVGWDDVLWGNQPLAEALIESLDDHLSLLPLRQPTAGPQRRTPAAQWKASLGELTQNYDIVLMDAGPLTDERKACDTAALAAQHPIDAALVVCDLRRDGAAAARDVGRRLVACDITRWNIVENFCPAAA
jgi:Mrp family chromosome partitioning ATPase